MVREVNNIPGGWPLGLERMIARLSSTEALRAPTTTASPDSFYMQSDSFHSYSSSSELDTESTRSFFLDHRTTLGRLIGINPGDGDLYFTNQVLHEELETMPMVNVSSDAIKRNNTKISCCICVPSIVDVLAGRRT